MRSNAQEPLLPPAWEALRFERKPRNEGKLAGLRRKGTELIHLTDRKCKREWLQKGTGGLGGWAGETELPMPQEAMRNWIQIGGRINRDSCMVTG